MRLAYGKGCHIYPAYVQTGESGEGSEVQVGTS